MTCYLIKLQLLTPSIPLITRKSNLTVEWGTLEDVAVVHFRFGVNHQAIYIVCFGQLAI